MTGVTTLVPYEALSPDILRRLIESFIHREGTDYGMVEVSLDEKVSDVTTQLKRREAFIVFDGESESTTIISATEARLMIKNSDSG